MKRTAYITACVASLLAITTIALLNNAVKTNFYYSAYQKAVVPLQQNSEYSTLSLLAVPDNYHPGWHFEGQQLDTLEQTLAKSVNANRVPGVQHLLGQLALFQGNLDTAQERFRFDLESSSRKSELNHFFLGAAYQLDQQPEEAQNTWLKSPQIAQYFLRAGSKDLYLSEKHDEALRSFSIALEISPESCEVRYQLGLVFLNLEQPEQALSIWSDLDQLDCADSSSWGEMYFQRGKLLSEQGYFDQATVDLRKSVEFDPRDIKRLVLLGGLLVRCETDACLTEARTVYEEAINVAPNNEWGYIGLCNIERRRGDFDAAVHRCEQAQRLFPDSAYPFHYMGLIFLDAGEYTEATAAFEQATRLDSTVTNSWLRLGEAYIGLNELDRARGAFEMALDLDPGNSLAEQYLSRLESK